MCTWSSLNVTDVRSDYTRVTGVGTCVLPVPDLSDPVLDTSGSDEYKHVPKEYLRTLNTYPGVQKGCEHLVPLLHSCLKLQQQLH